MFCEKLVIRPSIEKDIAEIAAIHRNSSGRANDAEIAVQMIRSEVPKFSLIADCDGTLIGHVLLSELSAPPRSLILSPLAVDSRYRELQVGSTLVRNALKLAGNTGFKAIFVTGDKLFFERFGFSAAKAKPFISRGRKSVLMAVELSENALASSNGKLGIPEPISRL
ncbi:MAG: GNAT family N-acetyltransferase [Rhizobiaceae bacterium]